MQGVGGVGEKCEPHQIDLSSVKVFRYEDCRLGLASFFFFFPQIKKIKAYKRFGCIFALWCEKSWHLCSNRQKSSPCCSRRPDTEVETFSYGCHMYFLLHISLYLQHLKVSQAPLTTGASTTRVTTCLAPAFSTYFVTGTWKKAQLKKDRLSFIKKKAGVWGGTDKRNVRGLSFNVGINLHLIFLGIWRQMLWLFHFSFCLGKASTAGGKNTRQGGDFFQVLCNS